MGKKIFEETIDSLGEELNYCTYMEQNKKSTKQPTLTEDSPEANILSKCVESGISIKNATESINEFWRDMGRTSVRFNTVYGLHCHLKPIVQKVKKRKTG